MSANAIEWNLISTKTPTLVAFSHACVLGVNRAVYREMIQLGWDVHLIIPSRWNHQGRDQSPEPESLNGPKLHPLELVGTHPRRYYYPQLQATLKTLRPNIVFLDADPVSKLSVDAGRWCKRNGAISACLSCENLSFHMRTVMDREGMKGIAAAIAKNVISWSSRRVVDQVFTISNDGTNIFTKLGFKNVDKIPLGFDPKFFHVNLDDRNSVRKRLGLNHTVISYFGRLVPEKGIHLLLETLSEMKGQSWHLMLDQFEAGNSPYLRQLNSIIDRGGIRDRIVFIHAAHGEIAQYMNASDIVVLPSLSNSKWKEQYGRVIPEAMACGCCVVVSNSGALPELVGPAGIIFAEGSSVELRQVLELLLSDSQRLAVLRQQGTLRAQAYSVQAQARLMHNKFQETMFQHG